MHLMCVLVSGKLAVNNYRQFLFLQRLWIKIYIYFLTDYTGLFLGSIPKENTPSCTHKWEAMQSNVLAKRGRVKRLALFRTHLRACAVWHLFVLSERERLRFGVGGGMCFLGQRGEGIHRCGFCGLLPCGYTRLIKQHALGLTVRNSTLLTVICLLHSTLM